MKQKIDSSDETIKKINKFLQYSNGVITEMNKQNKKEKKQLEQEITSLKNKIISMETQLQSIKIQNSIV